MYNNSFQRKLEFIQYNAALTITRAIREALLIIGPRIFTV